MQKNMWKLNKTLEMCMDFQGNFEKKNEQG